ncbi:MAG: flagellar hook-length control protein FliK, partial [Nitrospinota bacterium]
MFTISGVHDSRTPLRERFHHKASDVASSLQPGEVIEVEVLEVIGKNLALLDVRGSALLAETPEPLVSGTVIRTRVEEVSPKLILVLLRGGAKSQEPAQVFLRTHLPEKVPLAELITQLIRDLPALREAAPRLTELLEASLGKAILSSETVTDPEYLRTWLRISGLSLESRLARALDSAEPPDVRSDLKALLLLLARRLEGKVSGERDAAPPASPAPPAPSTLSLLNNVRAYVKNIELDQFRNVEALADGRSLYVQIPWGTAGERAELFFRRWGEGHEGKKKKGDNSLRICFLLRLRGLGELRVDATLEGRRVGCRFEVADPESADLVRRHLPRLRERLEALE